MYREDRFKRFVRMIINLLLDEDYEPLYDLVGHRYLKLAVLLLTKEIIKYSHNSSGRTRLYAYKFPELTNLLFEQTDMFIIWLDVLASLADYINL